MSGAETVADAASRWSTRVHSGTMSAAEQAELLAWRRAHPDHEKEFLAQEALNRAAASMPDALVRRLYGGDLPERPRLGRRRALRAGVWLFAIGASGAAAVAATRREKPADYAAQWSTRKGERRSVSLPEGTVLELNTDTQASVALYPDRRVVTLNRGEMLFDVSADAARPFIVEAGLARVQVTGTRFNVRRGDGDVSVAVQAGAVEVRSGPWWSRRLNVLTAGLGTSVDADGRQPEPRAVNLSAELAWVQGRVVFRNAPLAAVVRELNRYLAAPLALANEQVGSLRLSASFRLDDPAGIVEGLPAVLPVTIRRLPDGRAVLDARTDRP
ncbi:Protein FecR [compost metagenome]